MIALHLLWVAAIIVIVAVAEDARKARMADKEFDKRAQGKDLD